MRAGGARPAGAPAPAHEVGELGSGAVLMFLAELGVYAAVGVAGWRLHPGLGVASVLAMALWWGLLHSPKARFRAPRSLDLVLKVAWFVIGFAALAWVLVG